MGWNAKSATPPLVDKRIANIVNSAFARVGAVPATNWLVESELDAKAFLHITSIAAPELRKKIVRVRVLEKLNTMHFQILVDVRTPSGETYTLSEMSDDGYPSATLIAQIALVA